MLQNLHPVALVQLTDQGTTGGRTDIQIGMHNRTINLRFRLIGIIGILQGRIEGFHLRIVGKTDPTAIKFAPLHTIIGDDLQQQYPVALAELTQSRIVGAGTGTNPQIGIGNGSISVVGRDL